MQLVVTTLYATALAVQALVLCLLGWQLLPAILGARPIGLLIALVAAPAAIPVVLALRRKLSAEALIPRRLFTEDPLLALGSATLALIAIWLTARAFGDRGAFAKETLVGNLLLASALVTLLSGLMEYRIRRLRRAS